MTSDSELQAAIAAAIHDAYFPDKSPSRLTLTAASKAADAVLALLRPHLVPPGMSANQVRDIAAWIEVRDSNASHTVDWLRSLARALDAAGDDTRANELTREGEFDPVEGWMLNREAYVVERDTAPQEESREAARFQAPSERRADLSARDASRAEREGNAEK